MTEDVLTKLALFIYFSIVGVAFVSGFVLQWRLRLRHRDVWIELGRSTIGNQGIATSLKNIRFLFTGRHRELNDSLVTWLTWIGRAAFALTVVTLIFFLGFVLVAALQRAPSALTSSDATITTGRTPMFTHDAAGWKFHRPHDRDLFLLVSVLFYLGVVRSFLVRLMRMHADVWRELGEPLFFLNNTPKNGLRVVGFVMSDRHRAMNDLPLSIYVYAMRVLAILGIALLVWPEDSSRFFS